jgi:hypothetical protein
VRQPDHHDLGDLRLAPTSTAGVQNALSWAVWNIGIIATNRSSLFQPESSAADVDSR